MSDRIAKNMNKVFILGVGAQKAGTSWLHHYLTTRSFVETGLFREYTMSGTRFLSD